ncbi:unnamed protein product [Cladocopium goreaui]|uniref:Uncharacterized protein n=1 Tax=Cladocopium goreaui TaxID=2562237 RepID=A0A9P1GE79_9DINO|nr:unnamed protein product [Cladocopium goreaui]
MGRLDYQVLRGSTKYSKYFALRVFFEFGHQEEQWRQVKELIWKEAYKTVSSWFCWCSFDCCGKVEGIPLDEYETDFESDSEAAVIR